MLGETGNAYSICGSRQVDQELRWIFDICVNRYNRCCSGIIESEQFQLNSALIAQLVERVTSNDEVAGSTPS